jgi:serine phosphatase RsbU (regulator of sigma subunit)
MDISLVVINLEDKMAQYAGAFNPLFVVRNNLETNTFEIISVDGDRMPIGLYIKNNEPFLNKQIKLQKNDSIYLFSDGYSDQFGGTRDDKQKFMKKRFKQVLTDIQNHDMKQQKLILENIFMNWKADMPQTDDVTLIGIRI